MDIKECLEKGLLKQAGPDSKKALRSLDVAKSKLLKAGMLFEKGFYEDAVVKSYSAMFHAGRGVLFKDGFSEKSHYAIYVYLSECYRTKLEPRFLSELDSLRLERHEILYSLEEPSISRDEASDILAVVKDFIQAVEKIM